MPELAPAVLFVCLGNICRSPTAEAVFRGQLAKSPLAGKVHVDSAGTGDWHIGKAPDSRATAAAAGRGYALESLRARQVRREDFGDFDLILAMDSQNLSDLQAWAPINPRAQLRLFLDFAPGLRGREVPDPYYGGEDGFSEVLDLVEAAAKGLLDRLCAGRLEPL